MNTIAVQPPFTDTITWRVVIERSGTNRLHSMRLRADMPIKTVMQEILILYHREQQWWSRWLSQHVVEIATIVRICQHPAAGTDEPSVCLGITDGHIAHLH